MYDPFSQNHRQPAEGDRLFAWIYIPIFLACQITPHYFGLTQFFAWEIHSHAIWFFLAAMGALGITFTTIALINLVFWISDRRAAVNQNNDAALDDPEQFEKELNSEQPK